MHTLLLLAALTHWVVDPMGETRYLPDQIPSDGRANAPVGIIAAKGEYEPGSFILRSDVDLGKVTFEVSDLKKVKGEGQGQGGAVFPKEKLDLKTIKVWWQCGNAWLSYFADKGKKLCPELLLNDEDLVKVDFGKKCNYARTTETDGSVRYFWLGEPQAFHNRAADASGFYNPGAAPFQCMKPNFRDAPKHCGVTLPKNFSKQFLLTAHVTKDQPAGIYKGEIKVKVKGEEEGVGERGRCTKDRSNSTVRLGPSPSPLLTIPVVLRVLDFELPDPMCYEDVNMPFRTWFCDYTSHWSIRTLNGDDPVLARKQLEAICASQARHGQTIPSIVDRIRERATIEAAGQVFDEHQMLFESQLGDTLAECRADARKWRRYADREFGRDSRPLFNWGDEFGTQTMHGIREMVELYQTFGFRFQINSLWCWEVAPFFADVYWTAGEPDQSLREKGDRVRQMSGGHAYAGWYAGQHTGCENPAFVRRQFGFGPYRAGLTCHYNYAHHLDGWNDSVGDYYKPMMDYYGSGDGCIETIQFEGMREGLDDIRYATAMKRLALKYADSRDIEERYEARLALKTLGDERQDDKDLTTLRLEMIEHILKLKAFEK